MLISNLHSSNVIGCGRELNQSGKATEGHGWWLQRVVTEGCRGWSHRVKEPETTFSSFS